MRAARGRGATGTDTWRGTKSSWGRPASEPRSRRRCRSTCPPSGSTGVVEHNEGDLTAVFEAGVPLARAQEALAEPGQMVALDPPLGAAGEGDGATIGGVVATGDSGPLRHRYGAPGT